MTTPPNTNSTDEVEQEDLKQCDFCADGGNPQVCQTQKYIHPGGIETDYPLYAVICQDCDARGPEENTPKKAAERWGRRAAVAGPGGDAFTAYNQAIEDAKQAIRDENDSEESMRFAAATFINAIARKCSPHVYINRLPAAASSAAPAEPVSTCSCCDHPSGYLPAVPENGKWLHQGRDSVEPCTATPRRCGHCGKEKTSPECWNCGLFDTVPPESTRVAGEPYRNEEGEQQTTCANCTELIIKSGENWIHKYGWNKQCMSDKIVATPPTPTSDNARRAAEEVLQWLKLEDVSAAEPLAAIISKHFAGSC